MTESYPELVATVLDATDARRLAEFYRRLLGYRYQLGDEPPAPDQDDPKGRDWLVLLDRDGQPRLAVQQVGELRRPTWPDADVPQQLHLDLQVGSGDELAVQHGRALALGATLLQDRSTDPDESLIVYADPAGHPFCIIAATRDAGPTGGT
jgi:catechol 2,3-dioxygenase-like lactoylglutathione lyase family enzyme